MIPYSFLPESVQRISRLLPETLIMNAFNGLAMGGCSDPGPGGTSALFVTSDLELKSQEFLV